MREHDPLEPSELEQIRSLRERLDRLWTDFIIRTQRAKDIKERRERAGEFLKILGTIISVIIGLFSVYQLLFAS